MFIIKNEAMYTEKNYSENTEKSFNCDACQNVCSSLNDYQKHTYENTECKRKLPYSYQFCHAFDMNKTDPRGIFSINQLLNNFTTNN